MMKKVWSHNRPQRPNHDPMLDDILPLLRADRRSTWAKANVSGLSPSTLNNWESGKVRHPQSSSVQMAYRMLGYRLKPVKIK